MNSKKGPISKENHSRDDSLQALLDALDDFLFVMDAEGNLLHFNEAVVDRFGYSRSELSQMTIIDLRPPEMHDEVRANLISLLKGEIDTCKLPLLTKDGNLISVETQVIHGSWNNRDVFFCISRDLDRVGWMAEALKKSEQHLSIEREAYHIIAEAAVHTTDVADLCHRILSGLIDTLGYDLGTVRLCDEKSERLILVSSVGLPGIVKELGIHLGAGSDTLAARVARTKEAIFAPDVSKHDLVQVHMERIKSFDIETLIFWPILDGSGDLLGILNIASRKLKAISELDKKFFETVAEMFSTVLERRDAEDRRTIAEAEAQTARARAEFFNDLMSHDLNNMHQGILTALELIMMEDNLPTPVRAMTEAALSQVEHSLSLIANVRKFSMVDSTAPQLELIDVYHVITGAARTVNHSFPSKNLSLEIHFQQDQFHVLADEFLVDVFYNILHNAMKFDTSSQVTIEVHGEIVEDHVEIKVTDHGPGITDEQKLQLFTRLTKSSSAGLGIGLTLVSRILDRYGGSIRVEDANLESPQRGSSFIILLPTKQ
ncbi:MAG: ATP-binding protein [Candidatus Thorarchaeota archaeon]